MNYVYTGDSFIFSRAPHAVIHRCESRSAAELCGSETWAVHEQTKQPFYTFIPPGTTPRNVDEC